MNRHIGSGMRRHSGAPLTRKGGREVKLTQPEATTESEGWGIEETRPHLIPEMHSPNKDAESEAPRPRARSRKHLGVGAENQRKAGKRALSVPWSVRFGSDNAAQPTVGGYTSLLVRPKERRQIPARGVQLGLGSCWGKRVPAP